MTDSVDKLKRDYRDIEAPAALATRVRAEVADRASRPHSWMPATATVLVVVAALWLLPYSDVPPTDTAAKSSKPSLSTLATLKPGKPDVPAPSLSSLRSVKVPKMPRKPKLAPADPQTNSLFESELMEEMDHAHT
jgi:hypothetical protein